MNQGQNSSIHYRKSHGHSPQKMGISINLSERSKEKIKNQLSPRKMQQNGYTVHREDKLKVYIKFKPPSSHPQKYLTIHYLNQKQIQIERQTSTINKIYNYDYVFHEDIKSQDIFEKTCVDIINEVLFQNKYGLIFVYGHTGTGKTYTMGLLDNVNKDSKGIVPEAFRYLFKIKNKIEEKNYQGKEMIMISVSFNEIYMDEVYDMLDFDGNDKKLQIRENNQNKQPFIENNVTINISSIQQAYQLLNIGLQKRRIGQQKINKRSSRGHGLITLNIMMPNGKSSRLCFVDLAGSERIKESESEGRTLEEAVYINASLSALETLLMNINEQSVRIYRGNKLTRLLQTFMEYGKIRLFVTSNYQNTQPLEFAKRCKGIRFMERENIEGRQKQLINSMKNVSPNTKIHKEGSSREIQKYKKQVQKLQKENKAFIQIFTNLIILLNKLYKSLSSTLEEQNLRSNFTLSHQLNLNIAINKEVESRINDRINRLENFQEELIEKCMYGINNMMEMGKNTSEDSVNTSVSLNTQINLTNYNKNIPINSKPTPLPHTPPDLNIQNWLSLLKQPQKCSKRIQEIGFSIYQFAKTLGTLSEYKNIYKKEIFTYGIKAELLSNKNKQFENSINYLLKSFNDGNGGGGSNMSKKIIKDLKQFGVQFSDNSMNCKERSVSKGKKNVKNGVNSNNNNSIVSNNKIKKDNKHTETNQISAIQNNQLQNMGIATTSAMGIKSTNKQNNKKKLNTNQLLNESYHPQNKKYQYEDEQLFKSYENNLNNANSNQCINVNNKNNHNYKKIGLNINDGGGTMIKNNRNNGIGDIGGKRKKNNGGMILIEDL